MNDLSFVNRIVRFVAGKPRDENARRRVAQQAFSSMLRRRFPLSFRKTEPGPPAPERLVRTTAGMTEAEVQRWLNPGFYFRTGLEQMTEFLQALESVKFNIRTVGTVFEFGCGSARLLRHLRCIQGIRLVGSDVNGDCIQWCRKHIPNIEFYRNDLQPPLPFLEDASVDLTLSSSVFTHIPLEWQRPWLEEMYRVLRPRGIFLCTLLGRSYEETMLTVDDRSTLQKDGHLVLYAQDGKASLATQRAGSCDVFQTRAEVVAVFGSVFRILDYIDSGAGGQDLLVLEKYPSM